MWNSYLQLYGNSESLWPSNLPVRCTFCLPQKLNTTNECIVSSLTGLHTTVEQVCVQYTLPCKPLCDPLWKYMFTVLVFWIPASLSGSSTYAYKLWREDILLTHYKPFNHHLNLVSLSVICWELAIEWKAHAWSRWLTFRSSFTWMCFEKALLTLKQLWFWHWGRFSLDETSPVKSPN